MKFYKSRAFQIACAVVLLLVGYFVIDAILVNKKNQENTQVATANLEKTSVDLLTTDLNLYYVDEREYPRSVDALKNFLEKKNLNTETLSKTISKLNDFEYKVSGDYQSAQISFLSYTGEKITKEFNYKKDFH
jgi:cytoskeletal protein RodZ